MNNKGSFSVEGLICALVFSFFMIYISMFSKIMWTQNVIDDVLMESAKKIAVVSPMDRHGVLSNLGFNFAFKNIFISELKSRGYTLNSLDIGDIELKYSNFENKGNLGMVSVYYDMDLKIRGLRNVKDIRKLVFSKINYNMDFSAEDKLGSTVYITKTGKRYHKGNCRYLYKSKIPISKEEAKNKGYTPCKVCFGGT